MQNIDLKKNKLTYKRSQGSIRSRDLRYKKVAPRQTKPEANNCEHYRYEKDMNMDIMKLKNEKQRIYQRNNFDDCLWLRKNMTEMLYERKPFCQN